MLCKNLVICFKYTCGNCITLETNNKKVWYLMFTLCLILINTEQDLSCISEVFWWMQIGKLSPIAGVGPWAPAACWYVFGQITVSLLPQKYAYLSKCIAFIKEKKKTADLVISRCPDHEKRCHNYYIRCQDYEIRCHEIRFQNYEIRPYITRKQVIIIRLELIIMR